MQLRADRIEQTLPQQLAFEHVSGDYFVVRAKHISDFGALFPDVYPAEFRIGTDGKVKEVGIGWEEAMMGTKEEKIWLKRVQDVWSFCRHSSLSSMYNIESRNAH